MKNISINVIHIMLLVILTASCCHTRKTASESPAVNMPGPRAIIYQTHTDYAQLVPVILSDDKKTITSYPDVKDIFFKGRLAVPTVLHNDWLLDNRGITRNVAFINLTYEEYAKLESTPNAGELYKMIIDKDPLLKMYDCGLRSDFQDIELELNNMIDEGRISEFKLLK